MKNFLLMTCLYVLSGTCLYSQDLEAIPQSNWKSYINVDAGGVYPSGSIKESISIRQNLSSYYVYQSSNGSISTETYGYNLGIRWELYNLKYKAGISTGLRFTNLVTDLWGYSSSSADFFYLRYSMMSTDTKFARVKTIQETNSYLIIPVEIRFVPFQYKKLGFFGRIGAEFSVVNFEKNTDIEFSQTEMESYELEVVDSFGDPSNSFYSTLYASLGVKFGELNKTNYSFEVYLPSQILSENNFTLIDVDYFQGFKFSIEFPINK